MNKKLFLSMFAAAGMLLATSCSNDELESAQSGNEAQVSFSLGLEGNIGSRAVSDGTGAKKLVCAVYDNNLNLLNQVDINENNVANTKGQYVNNNAFTDLKETVNITLAKGQTYTIAFWAQNPDCQAYDTDNLQAVTIDYNGSNNDETRDAFFKTVQFEVKGNQTIDVELKRPFAQINVGVYEQDWIDAVKSGIEITTSKVTIAKAANQINLLTGAVSGEETVEYDFATIPAKFTQGEEKLLVDLNKDGQKEEYKYLSMSYILPNDGNVNNDSNGVLGDEKTTLESLNFTFNPVNGNDIVFKNGLNSVPVQRNWRTNILGQILTGDIQFNIEIDPIYNDTINITPGEMAVVADKLENEMNGNNSPEPFTYNVQGLSEADDYSVEIPSRFVSEEVTFNFTDIKNGADLTITGANYANTVVIKVPETVTIGTLTINTPNAHVIVAQGKYSDIDATTSSSTLVVGSGVTVVETITVNAGNVQIQKDAVVSEATIKKGENNPNIVVVYVDEDAQAPQIETTNEESTDVVITTENQNGTGGNDVYTIKLDANLKLTQPLIIDRPTIFDGNGKTLTSTATRAINVNTEGDVIIKNLTIKASGERAINVIQKAVNLTIEKVTASAANYTLNVATSAGAAQVAINNSTLTGACTVNVSSPGAAVTIDGSTINCNDNNTTEGEAYAALSLNYEAEGGSIIATNTKVNVTEGSDSMKGRNAAEEGTVTINGSTEDVVTTVAIITNEGSPYYYGSQTLADAVEFAKDGATITVIRDIETEESININKELILDLNGKTITGTDNATGSFGLINNTAKLTVKNGKITLKANNDRSTNAYSSVISNNPGGDLTLESDLVLEHLGGTYMAYALDNLTNGKGTSAKAAINGATLKSSYRAIRQFLNGTEATNELYVNSGTIEGANKSIFMQDPSKNANTGKLVVSADAVLKGDVYLFVTEGSTEWPVDVSISSDALKEGSAVTSKNVPAGYVVKEENDCYVVKNSIDVTNLEELIAALESEYQNIEIKDIINISEGNTVTLDLNGKTINAAWNGASTTNHIYAIYNYGTLTIEDSSADADGSINSRGIYNYGNLTLESGKISAIDGNGGYAVNNEDGSTFVMNGGWVAADNEDGDAPGAGYDATALDVPSGCTATLNAGKITNAGNFTFAVSAAGTLNIPDTSTITITGRHGAIHVNGGTTTINAGTFSVPENTQTTDNVTYVEGGKLIINGGTFIADNDSPNGGSCVYDASGGATIKGGTFGNSSGGDVWGTTGTTITGGTFENLTETAHVAEGATIVNGGKTYKKVDDVMVEQ